MKTTTKTKTAEKIKVGMTVVCRGCKALGVDQDNVRKGLTGKVVEIDPDGDIGVNFGEGFEGHNLFGEIKTPTGYWLHPHELRVVRPAKATKRPAKKRKK